MAFQVDLSALSASGAAPEGEPAPPRYPPRQLLPAGALLLLSVLMASCDLDTTAPPVEMIWVAEAFLAFPSEELLEDPWEGSALIRSGLGQTLVSVQVRDAEPGASFGWMVRSGSCATSGIPVASDTSVFATLFADGFGEATATVVLNGNLVDSLDYAVEILDADDPIAPPLGCGNLQRAD